MTLDLTHPFDRKIPLYQIHGRFRAIMQGMLFRKNLYLLRGAPCRLVRNHTKPLCPPDQDMQPVTVLYHFRLKQGDQVVCPEGIKQSVTDNAIPKCSPQVRSFAITRVTLSMQPSG